MPFTLIVFISLLLQCTAVYYSFRLISLTGHTRAWLLLSSGIATMALRRFMTLVTLSGAQATHTLPEYLYEIIGIFGSAMIVIGVISIRPVFVRIKNMEEEQRTLAVHLQEALNKVKILKNLLPICAHCKKIRDDDGYWQQIETYITEHSGTHFSHGICPDCVQILYPELSETILKKVGHAETGAHQNKKTA